jgi:hypothetical protein
LRTRNKLNNKQGSAMVLAIILMFLVSIVIVMFSSQISNGFKVTSRNYKDLKAKYMLESGVECAIAQVYTKTEVEYKNWKQNSKVTIGTPIGELYSNRKEYIKIKIPKIDKSDENLKYTINEINFNITMLIDKYKSKTGDNQYSDIDYLKDVNFEPQEQTIIVETEYNGKKYKMEAKVAFSVKDLEKGIVNYTIKSWNEKK